MSIFLFTRLEGVFHPHGSYVDLKDVARRIALDASALQFADAVQGVIVRRDLQIVICSSWLQKISLQQLRELAPRWMRHRIVGACEQIDQLDNIQRARRFRSMWSAVQRYVEANDVAHWVALDTTTEGWPRNHGTKARLVTCSSSLGVSDPNVLAALERAAWQARLEDGVHVRATLIVRKLKPGVPHTQLHWQTFFRLPLNDGPHRVSLTTVDERTGEARSAQLDEFHPGSEHLVEIAVKAICMTKLDSQELPEASVWPAAEAWTFATFEVEVLGTTPFGNSRVRLAVEPVGSDVRTTAVREEGLMDVDFRHATAEDADPVRLVLREALKSAQVEPRLPC